MNRELPFTPDRSFCARATPVALLVVALGPAVFGQTTTTVGQASTEAFSPKTLEACPFTPEEVEAALELPVEERQVSDMESPDGRDVGCTYVLRDSSTVLSVRQIFGTVEAPADAKATAAAKQGGKPGVRERAIAGDADGARWRLEKADDNGDHRVTLKYLRKLGKVRTSVEVYGGTFKNVDMQPKLLKLKRVP